MIEVMVELFLADLAVMGVGSGHKEGLGSVR
jgi:hypothetical protein